MPCRKNPSRRPAPLLAGILLAALLGSVTLTVLPAAASRLYRYRDSKGVEHFTENLRSVPPDAQSIEFVSNRPPDAGKEAQPATPGKTAATAGDDKTLAALQDILTTYRQSHTYSQADFFVCADMAMEVWNITRTKGYPAMIAAGHPKDDKATPPEFNHAWVLAEVAPSVWLAMETTGGALVFGRDNANYYRGHFFQTPRDFKAYLDERRGVNEQILALRDMQETLRKLKLSHDQTTADLQRENDTYRQQCVDKRLSVEQYRECGPMRQALRSKAAEITELEGRLKQLADSHAAALTRFETSQRLLNQPVQTVTSR